MASMLKPLNCCVSATVQSIFMKLRMVIHFDPLNSTDGDILTKRHELLHDDPH